MTFRGVDLYLVVLIQPRWHANGRAGPATVATIRALRYDEALSQMVPSSGIAAVRLFRDQHVVLVGGELGGLRRPASSWENCDILCKWLTAPPARASPAAGPPGAEHREEALPADHALAVSSAHVERLPGRVDAASAQRLGGPGGQARGFPRLEPAVEVCRPL